MGGLDYLVRMVKEAKIFKRNKVLCKIRSSSPPALFRFISKEYSKMEGFHL